MPAMPRPFGKAMKIAYAILGKPANLQKEKRKKTDSNVEKRLLFEETQKVR